MSQTQATHRPLLLAALIGAGLLAGPALAAPQPAPPQAEAPLPPVTQAKVAAALHAARLRTGAPGMAAAVFRDGKAVYAAEGVRAAGFPTPVTINDQWHIGSDGKAMTALMIARLVEAGKLTFDTRLLDVFPDFKAGAADGWSEVTLRQLLSHSAGIVEPEQLEAFSEGYGAPYDLKSRRAAMVRKAVAKPLPHKPGTAWAYANTGFLYAAAMAEQVTGQPYEVLMQREVFGPLHMTSAGFGAPASGGKQDQPLGHALAADKKTRIPIDARMEHHLVPPEITPAGDMHVSLQDWMTFATLMMRGAQGHAAPGYLKAETFAQLLTLPPGSPRYAGGWGIKRGPDGQVVIMTHQGSDDYWLAEIRMYPNRNALVLMADNDAIAAGEEPEVSLSAQLADMVRPAPPPPSPTPAKPES